MARQTFINLPVKDLDRSVAFFTALGFTFNPQFTDEKATCMIISEESFVMLLVEPFFKSFSRRDLCDTARNAEVITALSASSRDEVDGLIQKAIEHGANEHRKPEDHGWMYGRSFSDPDGHIWEIFHMDMNAIPQA